MLPLTLRPLPAFIAGPAGLEGLNGTESAASGFSHMVCFGLNAIQNSSVEASRGILICSEVVWVWCWFVLSCIVSRLGLSRLVSGLRRLVWGGRVASEEISETPGKHIAEKYVCERCLTNFISHESIHRGFSNSGMLVLVSNPFM